MSFQALARTWRPRRFDEFVGQGHVVRALTHALEHDKLHHALLFSGTRGVGKTTLARIIAKCLNCDRGVSARPCVGEAACGTCREIDEGRYVDLIEVDAASRTGVDDTRDLMDNVQYAPTRGRTKVYLIDEVHMLTKHSFNALLKTFEEPPPRVQFLLATTEPEKIPVTILSRCLQFPLKRLPAGQIADRLAQVVAAESLEADDSALDEIARAADGSMRDGLSLLDQAIAFGGGRLGGDDVREMLGTIGGARVAELVDAVIAARAADAIAAVEALYSQGIDMRYLLDALASAWQQIAAIQIVGEAVDDASQRWRDSAAAADPAAVQLFYDITMSGIRDFVYAPDPLVGVKMAVLRMLAFAPASPALPGRAQHGRGAPAATPAPAEKPAEDTPQDRRFDVRAGDHPEDWHALVECLEVSGFAAQLAHNGVCRRLDAEHIELEVARINAFLATENARGALERALAALWQAEPGPRLRVKVVDTVSDTPAMRNEQSAEARQREAVASIENDPIVKQLREELGARVRPETIKPYRPAQATAAGAAQQREDQ